MNYSRRSFLKHASGALAAAGLAGQTPGPWLWAATPADLFPEVDEAWLRELALAAMDAARSAGASFADIRVQVARKVRFTVRYAPNGAYTLDDDGTGENLHRTWPNTDLVSYYGIRAIVEGSWGFTAGNVMTRDAVAEAARAAVGLARRNRARHRSRIELAAVPKGDKGEWETEIEQDPFAISLYEQRQLVETVLCEGLPTPRVAGAEVGGGVMGMGWSRSTTVFASTEGALVLQRVRTALPHASVGMFVPDERQNRDWNVIRAGNGASSSLRSIHSGPYGYEAVGDAQTLIADMKEAAERAAARALASRNPIETEIGRYDLVFGASSVAGLLHATIIPALDIRRALGYRANREGTSFAAPPGEILGNFRVGSELLSVRGDRTQPKGAATVGWDDEGVRPEAYTLVENGVITDYHTDRETATELAGWYGSQGRPVRAHGVMSGTGRFLPARRIANLTMEPGKGATSVDDLIAGTKRGYYIENAGGRSDHQLLNTQFRGRHTHIRRITNGKLEEYVNDFAFQFITPHFWKNVDALGDENTAVVANAGVPAYAIVEPFPFATVRTVPMRVREVNVLNTGRTG